MIYNVYVYALLFCFCLKETNVVLDGVWGAKVLYHENVRECRRLARPTNTVVEDKIVTVPSCNERNESKTGNEPL